MSDEIDLYNGTSTRLNITENDSEIPSHIYIDNVDADYVKVDSKFKMSFHLSYDNGNNILYLINKNGTEIKLYDSSSETNILTENEVISLFGTSNFHFPMYDTYDIKFTKNLRDSESTIKIILDNDKYGTIDCSSNNTAIYKELILFPSGDDDYYFDCIPNAQIGIYNAWSTNYSGFKHITGLVNWTKFQNEMPDETELPEEDNSGIYHHIIQDYTSESGVFVEEGYYVYDNTEKWWKKEVLIIEECADEFPTYPSTLKKYHLLNDIVDSDGEVLYEEGWYTCSYNKFEGSYYYYKKGALGLHLLDNAKAYIFINNYDDSTYFKETYITSSRFANTVLANNYDSNVLYSVGSYCVYNNTLYKCISQTSRGDFDPTKWEISYYGVSQFNQADYDTEIINSDKLNLDYILIADAIVYQSGLNVSAKDIYMNNIPIDETIAVLFEQDENGAFPTKMQNYIHGMIDSSILKRHPDAFMNESTTVWGRACNLNIRMNASGLSPQLNIPFNITMNNISHPVFQTISYTEAIDVTSLANIVNPDEDLIYHLTQDETVTNTNILYPGSYKYSAGWELKTEIVHVSSAFDFNSNSGATLYLTNEWNGYEPGLYIVDQTGAKSNVSSTQLYSKTIRTISRFPVDPRTDWVYYLINNIVYGGEIYYKGTYEYVDNVIGWQPSDYEITDVNELPLSSGTKLYLLEPSDAVIYNTVYGYCRYIQTGSVVQQPGYKIAQITEFNIAYIYNYFIMQYKHITLSSKSELNMINPNDAFDAMYEIPNGTLYISNDDGTEWIQPIIAIVDTQPAQYVLGQIYYNSSTGQYTRMVRQLVVSNQQYVKTCIFSSFPTPVTEEFMSETDSNQSLFYLDSVIDDTTSITYTAGYYSYANGEWNDVTKEGSPVFEMTAHSGQTVRVPTRLVAHTDFDISVSPSEGEEYYYNMSLDISSVRDMNNDLLAYLTITKTAARRVTLYGTNSSRTDTLISVTYVDYETETVTTLLTTEAGIYPSRVLDTLQGSSVIVKVSNANESKHVLIYASTDDESIPSVSTNIGWKYYTSNNIYDTTVTYHSGDYCIYNDTLYYCNVYSTRGEFDNSKWIEVNSGMTLNYITQNIYYNISTHTSSIEYTNIDIGTILEGTPYEYYINEACTNLSVTFSAENGRIYGIVSFNKSSGEVEYSIYTYSSGDEDEESVYAHVTRNSEGLISSLVISVYSTYGGYSVSGAKIVKLNLS